ncbi:MAG: type II secretion system protein GspF [Myxococcales bacterium]|nr:type II secretion system protein GspF [Myxococcales bacterium]
MPVFEYSGKTSGGKTLQGVLDVESVRALKAALRRDGVFLTEYHETSVRGDKKGKVKAGVEQKSASRDVDVADWLTRITPIDVAEATRQLATLVKAGVPLVEALQAIVEQIENPKLKRVLAQVRTDINEGAAFWRALQSHPKVFETTYYNMVRAGETSGNLDVVLLRLSDFTESQVRLRNKVIGALTYPIIMMGIALAIATAMLVFVVPVITTMFDDLGAELPLITQVLIFISKVVSRGWPLIVLAAVGSAMAFRRWQMSDSGGTTWDRSVLRVPILGDLIRKIAISRFARTLGTLLSSGVPLLTALEIVENVVANRILAKAVSESRVAIREGDSIAGPLKRSGQFPPMVIHMIAVGERSGELEAMLRNVAESYESQVDSRVQALTSLLEPIMIVGMGFVVAFLVAAILLPMMKLTQAVGQQ